MRSYKNTLIKLKSGRFLRYTTLANMRSDKPVGLSWLASRFLPQNLKTTARYLPAIFIIFVLIPILIFSNVKATDIISQTDWSDNQYSYKDNINTSNLGQLDFQGSDRDWCNQPGVCDNNWQYRRKITIESNAGYGETDVNVSVIIPFEEGKMNSDYSDIRFSNTDSTIFFEYYKSIQVENSRDLDYSHVITEGPAALFVVKIPSFEIGEHDLFVYYGNDQAESLSSLDSINIGFKDNFANQDYSGIDIAKYQKVNTLDPLEQNFDYSPTFTGNSLILGDEPQVGSYQMARYSFNIPNDTYNFTTGTAIAKESHLGFSMLIKPEATAPYSCSPFNGTRFEPFGYVGLSVASCSSDKITFPLNIDHGHNIEDNTLYDFNSSIRENPYSSNTYLFNQYYKEAGDDNSTRYNLNSGIHPSTEINDQLDDIILNIYYPNELNNNFTLQIKDYFIYNSQRPASQTILAEETPAHYQGELVSEVFDVGEGVILGNINVVSNNQGNFSIQLRTGSDDQMNGATDWSSCNELDDGDPIYNSTCVRKKESYLQYRLIMSSANTNETGLIIYEVNFDKTNDIEPPTAVSNIKIHPAINSGQYDYLEPINDSWSSSPLPFISWDEASDNSGSIEGYCLYFGTEVDPVITSTSGMLASSKSPLDSNGVCPFAISQNQINMVEQEFLRYGSSNQDNLYKFWGTTDSYMQIDNQNHRGIFDSLFGASQLYDYGYINNLSIYIQPFDQAGNLGEVASAKYNLDVKAPDGMIIPKYDLRIKNTMAETINWLNPPGDASLTDSGSGLSGLKLCVRSALSLEGLGDLCLGPDLKEFKYHDKAWIEDVYNINDGRLTINPDHPAFSDNALAMISSGVFLLKFMAIDNVGNLFDIDGTSSYFIYSELPAGPPKDLTVDNPIPGANSFSFSWSPPNKNNHPFKAIFDLLDDGSGIVDFLIEMLTGSDNNTSYCWSINQPIDVKSVMERFGKQQEYGLDYLSQYCHLTKPGETSLPTGAYATKQGINTLYMISVNEAGSFGTESFDFDFDIEDVVPIIDGNVATIEFEADTLAPGTPYNVVISDISQRDSDPTKTKLQLALTWNRPTVSYDIIDHYKIQRSINADGDFATIGTTSKNNLSFIDTGLDETTYYYKVSACDNAGSCSADGEIVSEKPTGFYTEPPKLSPEDSQPNVKDISTKKATIYWKTDRESDSRIIFGTSPGNYLIDELGKQIEVGTGDRVTEHSVRLTNLQPGMVYYYKAKWTDSKTCKGNCTGVSQERSFETLPSPAISEVSFNNISISGADIKFSITNGHRVNLYYGKTEAFGGMTSINTASSKSTYSIPLTSLDDGTKYFIRLNGFDVDGNEYAGNIYSFNTLLKPKISNLRFQPVEGAASNTTLVSWNTNVPTDSALVYGITGAKTSEVIDSKLKTEHEITISGLEDDSIYSLTAKSRDEVGNLAVSDLQTFRTALDTRPPKISNINIDTTIRGSGSNAKGQIIVSWTTDEPATSQVAFGQGAPGNYNNKSVEDSTLSYEHTVVISELSTSSIYQVQPISKDKAGNEAKGVNQSAIVGRGTEDVFTIIFNSLRNIFGIR